MARRKQTNGFGAFFINSATFSITDAKNDALGASAKYSSQPGESTTFIFGRPRALSAYQYRATSRAHFASDESELARYDFRIG